MVRVQKEVNATAQRITMPLCWPCSLTCHPSQSMWKMKWCSRQRIEKSIKMQQNQTRCHLKLVVGKKLRALFSVYLPLLLSTVFQHSLG